MPDPADLRKRLQENKIPAAGQQQREFLPNGCLEQLLNREYVLDVLSHPTLGIPFHKRESAADSVLNEGQKVFAILVEMRLQEALAAFIENEILDSALPVDKTQLEGIISCDDVQKFVNHQWDYLAYEFRKGSYQRKIRDEIILPYLEQTRIDRGSSPVYKVLVHRAHQKFTLDASQTGVSLIRKETTASSPGSKHEESELLFLLGSLKHKNIVELLASYSQAGITNLLFEPADFDLHDFLQMEHRPHEFEDDTSIFVALHGLASGLRHLHNFRLRPQNPNDPLAPSMHGYHQDIKPRNILVRGSDFILADFGLSKLKDEGEDTKTMWKKGTFEYGAPECRDPITFRAGRVGRAFDIWSLSCILSEVMAYMEGGAEGVARFRNQRLADNIHGETRCFHDNAGISDAVKSYLEYITTKTHSTVISSLCSLIRRMFATPAEDRPDAEEVVKDLSRIAVKAFLEGLLGVLQSLFEAPIGPTDANVFRTRLCLERNRLRAWAGVLGFMPIRERIMASEQQAVAFFPEICDIFTSAIDRLKNPSHFEAINDDYDFIISTLHHANNSICSYLSDADKASVDSIFEIVSTTEVNTSLPRMEAVALDKATPEYENVGAVAAMKYMSILLSQHPDSLPSGSRLEPSLIEKDAGVDELGTRPQTYWYSYGYQDDEKRRVLVEWKGYGKKWTEDPKSKEFEECGEEMFRRVRQLVAMLMRQQKPANFRILDCLGAFHDTQKRGFGIVYGFPDRSSIPVRLHRLLRRRNSQAARPSLDEKFAVAKALVASIHSFHVSGWIHKNINSYNILFFSASPDKWTDLDFKRPYVVGFDHSRQDGPNEYTEGLEVDKLQREYQHPLYRDRLSSFQKQFDYYSLGLVLLEVGTWICLSEIQERNPTCSPSELKDKYIEYCNKQLPIAMGNRYHEATMTCLQADSELSGEDQYAALDFQRDVVDKLSTCAF